ncbi:MAG: hypothetical protein ACI8WB_004938 [Phenylobacterium sp.]|jgi:hypothetical protein
MYRKRDGLTLNQQKELFSLSIATAICASSGCTWSQSILDVGIDLYIHGNGWNWQPQIDVQLKSTSDFSVIKPVAGVIKYPLAIKNYQDLIRTTQQERILVLAILPDDPYNWIKHTEYQISLHYGIFWANLRGMEISNNKKTVMITIPLTNRFDSLALKEMMKKIDDNGGL